jgi:hypothetical protein
MMYFVAVLSLFGALAFGSLEILPVVGGNITAFETRNFSPAEMHANVLKTYPPELVITSDALSAYMSAHPEDTTTLVYLSDTYQWVRRANDSSSLSKRQSPNCPSGESYVYYETVSSKAFWDPWQPISDCLSTGLDSAGGTEEFDWSYSLSISESGGYVPNFHLLNFSRYSCVRCTMIMMRLAGLAGVILHRLFLELLGFQLPKHGLAVVLLRAIFREILLGRCGDGSGSLGQRFIHTLAVLAIPLIAGRTPILGL